jgi:hypothetical protein
LQSSPAIWDYRRKPLLGKLQFMVRYLAAFRFMSVLGVRYSPNKLCFAGNFFTK